MECCLHFFATLKYERSTHTLFRKFVRKVQFKMNLLSCNSEYLVVIVFFIFYSVYTNVCIILYNMKCSNLYYISYNTQ